jgi:hypothetical protein
MTKPFLIIKLIFMRRITVPMLLASLSLMAWFAGCSKNPANGESEGIQTKMSVRLTFPREQNSRATGDVNATDAEAQIKTVDVYIYAATGEQLSHTPLTAADFTPDISATTADVYVASTRIVTTTGTKNVFVGVNLTDNMRAALYGQPMSHIATNVQSIARSEIDPAGGLPMFSTAVATKALVADETSNIFSIDVKRIVAKVTVEKSPTLDMAGIDGTVGEISFAINNLNSRFFMIQGAAADYKDPNWTAAEYVDSDFSAAADADYVTVADGPQTTPDDYAPHTRYALENTSQNYTLKEVTRVTIRAKFIPAQINSYDGNALTIGANPNLPSTFGTFYSVAPSVGGDVAYFNDPDMASAYAAANGNAQVKTYTDGYNFWNIYLNAGNDWDVLRNDYYKCNITRIMFPGAADATIANADATPTEETNIMVTINPLFWNAVPMVDYELTP